MQISIDVETIILSCTNGMGSVYCIIHPWAMHFRKPPKKGMGL